MTINPTKEALRRFALGTLQRRFVVEGSYCMGRDWFLLLSFRDDDSLVWFREELGKWIAFDGPAREIIFSKAVTATSATEKGSE